jgi:hypothetical protein
MLIPQGFGERESSPRSTRWPKDLAERIQKVADETGHDWTPALFHLAKWAVEEYERQRTVEGAKPAELKKGRK